MIPEEPSYQDDINHRSLRIEDLNYLHVIKNELHSRYRLGTVNL
jgi:hypothetical protein